MRNKLRCKTWFGLSSILSFGVILQLTGCGRGSTQDTGSSNNDPTTTTSKACGVGATVQTLPAIPATGTPITTSRWASSYNWQIAISAPGQPRLVLTDGDDFKPSWSLTSSQLTFFHALQYGSTFDEWKTNLCVIGADGSNPRVLTTDPGSEGSPSWSPDGHYLAFQTDRAGSNEIDIMNLNGEIIRKLSLAAQDASEPVWKP